jgi:glucan endo-1,3-alpha-glucosidase
MDHAAYRFLLGYFIAAYKAGTPDISLTYQGGVAWYRTTWKSISGCSDYGKPPLPCLYPPSCDA